MTESSTIGVRDARLPEDLEAIERLWFEDLTWGNEEMQARHGIVPQPVATKASAAPTARSP